MHVYFNIFKACSYTNYSENSVQIIELLINNNANVNLVSSNTNPYTALSLALRNGNKLAIELLLRNNAEVMIDLEFANYTGSLSFYLK